VVEVAEALEAAAGVESLGFQYPVPILDQIPAPAPAPAPTTPAKPEPAACARSARCTPERPRAAASARASPRSPCASPGGRPAGRRGRGRRLLQRLAATPGAPATHRSRPPPPPPQSHQHRCRSHPFRVLIVLRQKQTRRRRCWHRRRSPRCRCRCRPHHHLRALWRTRNNTLYQVKVYLLCSVKSQRAKPHRRWGGRPTADAPHDHEAFFPSPHLRPARRGSWCAAGRAAATANAAPRQFVCAPTMPRPPRGPRTQTHEKRPPAQPAGERAKVSWCESSPARDVAPLAT